MARRRAFLEPGLARFLAIGVANTALCYAVYLIALTTAPRLAAYTLAVVFSICFTTIANIRVAFVRKLTLGSVSAYALYYCAYWLASVGLLEFMVRALGVPETLAPAAVLPLTVPPHYLLSRRLLGGFQPRA